MTQVARQVGGPFHDLAVGRLVQLAGRIRSDAIERWTPEKQRHTSGSGTIADAGGEGTLGLRLSAQQLALGAAGPGSQSAIEVLAAQLDGSAPDTPVGIWLAQEPTDIVSEGSE